MKEYIRKNGFADDQKMLEVAFALATHYGEAIAALSCQMYEATAAAQGKIVRAAEVVATPDFKEVAVAVHGTMKESKAEVPDTIGKIVKQIGADTILKNAHRDGAEFAWVPHGDTCEFCIILASRGWQYEDPKNRRPRAEHIHANCDCQYAVRFDGKSSVEGYKPEQYKKIYDNMPGKTPDEKKLSLRRSLRGKNPLTLEQLEFIIDLENNSRILGNKSPGEWKHFLENLGFDVKPLGRGSLKDVEFEDGGGYRINYRGDGYLQYHPPGSHHGDAYYKRSSAKDGTKRYNLDGSEKHD